MPQIVDLRSDTVTRPTDAMRKAMYQAEVGDDVYREDPTTCRLEELAAEITGKEAALFVSSGSMGNLLAIYCSARRGSTVLTDSHSHIIEHELGSAAALAGVLPVGLESPRGILSVQMLRKALHPGDYTANSCDLIELENTTNGSCYPLKTLQEIRELSNELSIRIHMDGARLFNASVRAKVPASELCRYADSVSFCLSKGLGAPVGSMLCGDREFITAALRARKMFGGGMRQTGILAAAGIYALEHNIARLKEDHEHAQLLSKTLSELPWADLDPLAVETNIIFFDTVGIEAAEVTSRLEDRGILCFATGRNTIRMVTHLDISKDDIAYCRDVFETLI